MKQLSEFKEDIHKCSKCGLCQAVCPIYKATGNDCTVSRGQFVMLDGVLKGDLKLSKKINHYLDLCLKCGKCSEFCPSGIDVVDVIVAAKSEYFKKRIFEKIWAFLNREIFFGIVPKALGLFTKKTKSEKFDKKVLYFAGCGGNIWGDKAVIKVLNSLNIEVINPGFGCCGITSLLVGDLDGFNSSIKSFMNIVNKYSADEVVVSCASCEMVLKKYSKWVNNPELKQCLKDLKIKNVYEYIKENNLKLKLKTQETVTYHKPCHLDNFSDVEWILKNTENLQYIEMDEYDSCCGLYGLKNLKEYKLFSKIYSKKFKNIVKSGAGIVLTSCLGCEIVLKIISGFKYNVDDLLKFISKKI